MLKILKDLSLMPKGLRYKTMVAFSLMSLIPLLICVWLVTNYIFPNLNLFIGASLSNISLILFISIFISLLGFFITKEMIDPVIKIAGDAKVIANGDMTRVIEVKREDEVGDLSKSLNIMTQKIKENIEELRLYGERTKIINMEINKKVLALSSLLQIGNLISSSAELQEILNFILQKICDLENDSASFLALLDENSKALKMASAWNLDKNTDSGLKFQIGEMPLNIVYTDSKTPSRNVLLTNLVNVTGLKNMAILPISIAGKPYGVLVVGNKQDGFVFLDDERELLRVFLKQVSIAIENDLLIKRAKELAIKDELTNTYNQSYINNRLDEEIKRSIMYQRPCGYILIDVDGFNEFHSANGEARSGALLKALAEILKASVSEVDKVARLENDRFAIVLPEKNKRQIANFAEELRKKIEDNLSKIIRSDKKLTVSIGVSENPIDGSTAAELMDKAMKLVRDAKTLGKNRVAV